MSKKNTRKETPAALQAAGNVAIGIGNFFRVIYSFFQRTHKLFLAAPVVVAAVMIADYCWDRLPEPVGILLQENGEFLQMVSKEAAVFTPLVVTLACLVLMFCSRRTLYPWLISLFSLVLPFVILLTNIFPG